MTALQINSVIINWGSYALPGSSTLKSSIKASFLHNNLHEKHFHLCFTFNSVNINMVKYIKYQISLFRWLTYIQVCRHYIVEDERTHQLSIRKTGRFWILIYYLLWINTTVKVIYLFMTYQGWLLEVEFLDKMSIWVYFLMLMEMAQETVMFCKKTPLCEILLANWRLQREIFLKLNRPFGVEEQIMANDKLLVHIHA